MTEQIDLRASDIASEWWHENFCLHCKAKTGHEEFMTNICLTCGTYSERNCMGYRASRRYMKDGAWVIQHRYESGTFGYSPYNIAQGLQTDTALMAIGFGILFIVLAAAIFG
jgi:hypothetical protein